MLLPAGRAGPQTAPKTVPKLAPKLPGLRRDDSSQGAEWGTTRAPFRCPETTVQNTGFRLLGVTRAAGDPNPTLLTSQADVHLQRNIDLRPVRCFFGGLPR